MRRSHAEGERGDADDDVAVDQEVGHSRRRMELEEEEVRHSLPSEVEADQRRTVSAVAALRHRRRCAVTLRGRVGVLLPGHVVQCSGILWR